MKLCLSIRQTIAGWVFFVFFGILLYLFDGKTFDNLYKMFIVKEEIGLILLILAGIPIGFLISQVSWFIFSVWPVNFKFPWAVVESFKKAKQDGIGEDSQSDQAYFKDADERMVNFNRTMASTYSLHMDVITAIILAFIGIYFRMAQVGIKLSRVLRYAGTSRLALIFAIASIFIIIALVHNARNCRRDLIDQKRLWNREKLDDKAKYIHINPAWLLLIAALIIPMFFLKLYIWWMIFFFILLHKLLYLYSLYKISL